MTNAEDPKAPNPPSLAVQRLNDLHALALERRRLLARAERHLIANDLLLALDDVLCAVRLLNHAEETVMRLHVECLSMLEQAGKILKLDADRRPVQVFIPKEQNDG